MVGYGAGILALCSLLFAIPAGAVGVAVTPAEVTMTAVVDEPTAVRISISNPSTDVAVFEVYPDDFAHLIKANPSSFTLESGAEKFVEIKVTALQTGQFSTVLSVVARPLAANAFQAGSGVKIPLVIIAKEGGSGLASALATVGTSPWAGLVALGALVGWGLYKRRGKIVTTPKV